MSGDEEEERKFEKGDIRGRKIPIIFWLALTQAQYTVTKSK